MSKNVLDRLSPGYAACALLFANAGLDLAAIQAAGPDGLKNHLDTIKGATDVAAAVEAAISQLQASLATANQTSAAHSQTITMYTGAFAAKGITPKASDETAGLTQADVEAAVDARISIRASEQLAGHGLDTPLVVTPSNDPTKPGAKGAKVCTLAEFQAMTATGKMNFSVSGGRIVD